MCACVRAVPPPACVENRGGKGAGPAGLGGAGVWAADTRRCLGTVVLHDCGAWRGHPPQRPPGLAWRKRHSWQ